MTKVKISEAEYERMVDAAVMRELRTDRRYLHAENAEEQAEAEEAISNECHVRVGMRYEIAN